MSREDKRDAAVLIILALLILLLLGFTGNLWLEQREPRTWTRSTPSTHPAGDYSVHVIGGNGTPAARTPAPATGPTGTVPVVTGVTGAPVPAAPELEWSVGLDHRCRVEAGRALCEGGNRYGQSGNPELPVKVEQVVAGQGSTCARGEGRVFCWGFRQGPGATTSTTPVEVQLRDVDHVWNGPGGTVCAVSIEKGGLNQKGDDDPGSLWCWGEGVSAEGITGRDWSDVPVKIAESADWDTVAVGWRTVCALQGEVELWCWGGQPDGTHTPTGQHIDTDSSFRSIRLQRIDEKRERVCGVARDRSERCHG